MLVTGATGFVGSAVMRRLIEAGHDVRVIARAASNRENLQGHPVEIMTGDVTERASLDAALKGVDALFHVAADYRLWVPDPERMYAINVDGTRNIMLAAGEAGVGRIVYTSSVATLGLRADGGPAGEDTPVTLDDMIGHYKRSKFLAEREVSRMVREDGLPAIIVNPSTPVGPNDVKPTPTGRLIVDAASGKMPAYVDTGLNFAHVDDVAEGHLLALRQGRIGERYILGAENLSLRDLLHRLAAICGRKPPRVRLPHNLVLPIAYIMEVWSRITGGGEPMATVDGVKLSRKQMYFSIDKARFELGYSPRPVDEALRDAVEWFRAHGYCP
ncbi:MAG: hopanoid-associated sugar epimerase [Sphingomonadales bacterium]